MKEEKVTAKDEFNDFFQVFSYIENPEKTKSEYISAINCLKETALQQMIMTKKQYGKEDNYIAWHGYQSFKSGEVSPEECHRIGVELAKRMWGDKYQIIVTTHLDKDHLHNHFCFNSVSFLDGKKYNYSKQEQKRLRDESGKLCREHGLSVIEKPRKAPSRPVYLDEKSGKPTSPFMKEELRKLDEITMQVRYMEENNITTLDELHDDMEKNQQEMDRRIDCRTRLQHRIRRAAPEEKVILRKEKSKITTQIAEYRRKIKCAKGIEKRSADIDDRMNALYENELKAREPKRRKEDKAHVR